ncbi:MAG: hypothetical protein KF745_02195 [Phycisphaeraceae bacterium]|nr:hypothetical protein [Phycisphaeraceae bacterium]
MEQLRRALTTIQQQLARLNASQRLLILSLCVVAAMALVVVSLISGRSQLVALPGFSPAEQDQAAAFLQGQGITAKVVSGTLMVHPDSRYIALAQLQQGQKLPGDKKLLFENLAQSQNWMMSRLQLEQQANVALQNELAKVAASFPGIEAADVFISSPPPSGLGTSFRKPTATVRVHTRADRTLTQDMVDSLADLVAGSTPGLAVGEVRVMDSAKGRRYRPRSADDIAATGYLEQAMKVEQHVQDKLLESLRYIDDVIVTVNAQVDLTRKEMSERQVLPKGKGTEALVSSETTSTSTQTQPSGGGETGVRPNTQASIGISSATSNGGSTQEQTETRMENAFGARETREIDPSGRPIRINVTIGVPMSWAASIARQRKAAAAPAGGAAATTSDVSDAEVQAAWGDEKKRLEQAVQPLVDTEAGRGGQSAGTVIATLIPVLTPASSTGGAAQSAGVAGTFGSVTNLVGSGAAKTTALGALAAIAIGMMVLMVRKAGRAEPLPSAEELAGIPPQITGDSDLIGEAGEGDTAMAGIEIDDTALKTKKMLEQVSSFVKKDPAAAASLFSRWMTPEL